MWVVRRTGSVTLTRIRRPLVISAWVAICVLASAVAHGSTRYDPRLRFRTISTARFDIHFHQGEEELARRLARVIEKTAADVDAIVGAAVGRVQVILVDQHDLSNGWATPLPYNTIEISVAAPRAEESIGNTDDWLRLVFSHEYTHIAHLSRAGGWIRGLRKGFGRLPLLFPNLYEPIWGIEGIATWQESMATGGGRVRAGDFRLLLDRAAAASRFEPLDRVNGGNVDWPSGATPYLYGAFFHQYLADRYGADTLRALADETSRRLPYLGSRAFKKVYGRSLGELWRDFELAAKAAARPEPESRAVRLTHHGFNVIGPRQAPDGRIYYATISPHRFPALMEIDALNRRPRELSTRFLGNRIAIAGDDVVVDEIDLVRNVAMQSDLYLVDRRGGHRRRLTRGARAGDPDVARDGLSIVCTIQMPDRRALATTTIPKPGATALPAILLSEPSTDFAAPRWSPDGRLIAAERHHLGRSSDIVLVEVATRTVRAIAALPNHRSAGPAWTADGRTVLFSAASADEPFRIYAVDVASGLITRLEDTGSSAQSPDVSPDGKRLVFVGYTIDGYDLFSMPLDGARWTPVEGLRGAEETTETAAPEKPSIDGRSYTPWRTLVPQFWTPTLESDADELVVGAATGSIDALGRHAFGVEAGWSVRARPDWRVAYAYDRWWPTLFASVADDTDPWREGELRTREADVGALLRVARVRFSFVTLGAFHVATDKFECLACAPAVALDQTRASLRGGANFSNARAFGYSISDEEGGRAIVTVESTRRALGADGDGVALTADLRRYWRTWPRHGVVAFRAAAAGSWGDREAERLFSAAGSGPRLPGFGFGLDAIGLLRGFDEDAVVGTRAATMNADYRVPLLRIDRGAGTVPLFLRRIHAAVFLDTGHAWTDTPRWSDVRTSVGAELSMDTVIGFALPLTFTAGGAWRRDGANGDRGLVAFARIGRAF